MNNRINKPKKHSKLKHTIINDRIPYNSPAKFSNPSTTNALSSGCCPKQPPNISNHYLQKKKLIQGQYYILGKQNKGKLINNASQHKQNSFIETTDRFRQKRNTHHLITYQTNHHKLLQVKKPNQQPLSHHTNNLNNNYQTNNNTMKQLNKSKLHTRNPITLGSMKNKHLKASDHKQNVSNINKIDRNQRYEKNDKYEKQIKKQLKSRNSYIPQSQQCNLKCFQNLSNYSIAQSKIFSSTASNNNYTMNNNYFAQMTHFNLQESNVLLVQKHQRTIQSRKAFHKSPKIMSPTNCLKYQQKTPQQQIAQFQAKISQINVNFQHDSLTYMQTKDKQLVQTKNMNCYLGNQLNLDVKKRAHVVSWMIDLLSEIDGRRQTLANAVNIFDRYLSLTLNIPLDHIQCTAAASLLIAAKLQDKSLSAEYMSGSTLNKYSTEQVMDQEYKIFQTLNFKVNTPTLNCWANRLATQWDKYLQSIDLRYYDIIYNNMSEIMFKNSNNISYYNFRTLCQYVDISILDICTLRYQPRMLSLAFIYLIVGIKLDIFSKDKVINIFPNSSLFLTDKHIYNEFFNKFLKDSFDLQLIQLLPMIQYCATFVILPLKFDLPVKFRESQRYDQYNGQNDEQSELNYEQMCSYQTSNQHTLSCVFMRNRNVF